MNNLRRELAPISDSAWALIDEEATRVLRLKLAGRKLVDLSGPKGPAHAAVNTGGLEPIRGGAGAGVEAARRQVLPLIELRVAFELSRAALDSVEGGATAPDLGPLVDAATRIAAAEDGAIFRGFAAGGITGMAQASAHPAQAISNDYAAYPHSVAEAIRLLRDAGIDGPYALALGSRCHSGLAQATEGGYPVLDVVKRIVDGPVVWGPTLDGGVLLSTRGGDFELTVGRDLSIGYLGHSETAVRLYLTESFTFRVLTPEAAVALAYRDKRK